MRRLLGLGILTLAAAWPARAQITPRYEVGAGFQYMAYHNSSGAPRLNMIGGDASVAYNYYRWLGVAVDVSVGHNRQSSSTDPSVNGATTTVLSFMAGPRFYPIGHRKFTLFGDVLFGGGYLHANVPAVPPFPGQNLNTAAFGWAAEVGADYSIGDHWAIRAEGGYLSTRFYASTAGSQGNERVIAGVVYRWGVRGPHRHK